MTTRMATEAELLDLLAEGETLTTPERAVLLARATGSEPDPRTLPLGARNRLILGLRSQLLGQTIEAGDVCPCCRETVDFTLTCAALDGVDNIATGPVDVRLNDYVVTCRPPTTADLLDAARAETREAARQRLLAATVIDARKDDAAVEAVALPADLVEEVGRQLAAADPLAEVSLTMSCESCGGTWDTVLDVSEFVWKELRDWGRRLLWEIHVLAGAYGWGEREILAVPPGRRQVYLGLVLDG